MPLDRLNIALSREIQSLKDEGRAKAPERIITAYIPAHGVSGPRYKLAGAANDFLRMNSNSYLSLANHPVVMKAADQATHEFGVGPGAVRFIDGTYNYHVDLEKAVARFTAKPAAKIFNSAYTANLALALTINNKLTYWIGDALNHNSIIRAMRISNVPSANKAIYKHNDMTELRHHLENVPAEMERVIVIFDGIFSMRGDNAPLDQIVSIANEYAGNFKDSVITVVDDSHGIGAYGDKGRGTPDYCGADPDIIIGTFGKAFGVNGGFIAGSAELVEAVRQKADTYIYTNPLSVADCAAAIASIRITDSDEGLERLQNLKKRTAQFRQGVADLGMESISGPHPVVPVLVRDTAKTHRMVQYLFTQGILVVGLTFPVVPRGDETMRFQINAAHTEADIAEVLRVLGSYRE